MATTSVVPYPLTGTFLDALTNGTYWVLGADRQITWAVANSPSPDWAWNSGGAAAIAAAMSAVLSNYAEVANVRFPYVGWYADNRTAPADIVLSATVHPEWFEVRSTTYAWAYFPNELLTDNQIARLFGTSAAYPNASGDVILNFANWEISGSAFDPGSIGYFALLHEVGHALGLKHPHDDGGTGSPTFGTFGYRAADTQLLTVMSYSPATDLLTWLRSFGLPESEGYPSSLMPLDVIALQMIYGPNLTTRAGDTIYHLLNDGTVATYWDASGIDKLSAAGSAFGWRIQAAADVGTLNVVVAVPFAAIFSTGNFYFNIENISGSQFGDDISGTGGANVLEGLGGNDRLQGGAGNDTLLGGAGNDELDGGSGDDRLDGGDGEDLVSYEGAPQAVIVTLTAGTAIGGSGSDSLSSVELVIGSSFADLLAGDAAPNGLVGGPGNDFIEGGAGGDLLAGGPGDDVLVGGAGDDLAVFDASINAARITYEAGTRQLVVSSPLDGTDRLSGVEQLSFGGAVVSALQYIDDTAPAALSYAPASGAVQVEVNTRITIAFSEPIKRGTGTITIRTDDGAVFAEYGPGNVTNVAVLGSTLTMAPATNLAAQTTYRIEIPTGAITDLVGNSFAGTSSYSFSTARGANSAPVASGGSASTVEDSVARGALPPATDAQRDAITYSKDSDPSHGSVAVDRDGTFVYTPASNFSGSDSFRFAVSDAHGGRSTYQFDIRVEPVIDDFLGTAGADEMDGFPGPDRYFGLAGSDAIAGGAGNDTIDGGPGIDTAVMQAKRADAEVGKTSEVFTVTTPNGGTDRLVAVERLRFEDTSLALDIDGNAGVVAKTLGAVFGKASVRNAAFAGIGLYYADSGMSYEDLMRLAIGARLGQGASHMAVVELLYTNVVGIAPSQADTGYFVGLLDSGAFSIGSLGVLAADTALNASNVDLLGLAQAGLAFTPFGP